MDYLWQSKNLFQVISTIVSLKAYLNVFTSKTFQETQHNDSL